MASWDWTAGPFTPTWTATSSATPMKCRPEALLPALLPFNSIRSTVRGRLATVEVWEPNDVPLATASREITSYLHALAFTFRRPSNISTTLQSDEVTVMASW